MLRLDELEKLSRYAAGDLSDEEAEQVKADLQRRPELASALEQLNQIDIAARALPDTLPCEELEAIIQRVARPRRVFRIPGRAVAVSAALALIGSATALGFVFGLEPSTRLVALSGVVNIDGAPVAAPSQAVRLAPGAVVHCGLDAAAIVETRRATLLLARQSDLALPLRTAGSFKLQSGTLAATGRQIPLAAGDSRVELTGRGVLSWEPEEELVRVTQAMEANKSRLGLKSFKLPLAAGAIAAAGVTVLVLEGKATVTTGTGRPFEVTAGQKWSTRHPTPTAIGTGTRMASAGAQGTHPKPEPLAVAAQTTSGTANLAALSKEQLVAEVVRLRAQNTALAEQNQQMQKELGVSDPKAQATQENYYRQDPDELRAMAERGEMRLHPPPTLGGGRSVYGQQVATDLGLTPEEQAKIKEIYDRSAQSIREGLVSLYVEIGGDRNVANALDTFALMQELRSKSTDQDAVVRTAMREHSGLEAPVNPNQGPALLRMYRLLFAQEDWVLDQLDALLGPARAEQFVNHPNTSHSTWSTTSRPTPRP